MSSRPALLFLTQVLPFPLDAGPRIRAYYTLRHLAQSFRITLVSFVRSDDAPESIDHLRQYCDTVVTVPLRRDPRREGRALIRSVWRDESFLIVRDQLEAMEDAVISIVRQGRFSFIHADQLSMARYALLARQSAPAGGQAPRAILDQHNAVHLIPRRLAETAGSPWLRLWWRREADRVARYEARVCRQFDKVVTVTDDDRQALAGLYEAGDRAPAWVVIPICIDVQAVRPIKQPTAAPTLLFIGGMHWPPNADAVRWFVAEVLPMVRRAIPDVRFCAVGRSAPSELRKLSLQANVSAPGYVLDTDRYWSNSRVCVVPLRAGGGMRVKILEAWAWGVPVVSTTVGAEGLVCKRDENIVIADSPHTFSEAVLRLLTDSDFAQQIAAGGRTTLEEHYDWRRIYPAWEAVYSKAQ